MSKLWGIWEVANKTKGSPDYIRETKEECMTEIDWWTNHFDFNKITEELIDSEHPEEGTIVDVKYGQSKWDYSTDLYIVREFEMMRYEIKAFMQNGELMYTGVNADTKEAAINAALFMMQVATLQSFPTATFRVNAMGTIEESIDFEIIVDVDGIEDIFKKRFTLVSRL